MAGSPSGPYEDTKDFISKLWHGGLFRTAWIVWAILMGIVLARGDAPTLSWLWKEMLGIWVGLTALALLERPALVLLSFLFGSVTKWYVTRNVRGRVK